MTEKTTVKSSKRINIEISMENYDKLRGIANALGEIWGRHVKIDVALKVVLCPKLIDYTELFDKKEVKTEVAA